MAKIPKSKTSSNKKIGNVIRRLSQGSKVSVFIVTFAVIGVVAIGLSRADPVTDLLNSVTIGLNSLNTQQKPKTATLAPAGAPLCGGVTLAKAGGGNWQCTFADEFDGTALDRTKWAPQVTASSNFYSPPGCYMDSPNNVFVSGGFLNLAARKEAQSFTCKAKQPFNTQYTLGMVSTWQRFSQAYGRFEVRAKVPNVKTKGLQESFWLWPDNALKYGAWPRSGEIDIAEIYHQYPDRAIPFIHYAPGAYDPNVTNNYCMIDISQFHSYVAEWTTKSIKITIDGKTCLEDLWTPAAPLKKPQPFDHPYMIALTQAFGLGTNSYIPNVTPLPAVTQVDYVRVWK